MKVLIIHGPNMNLLGSFSKNRLTLDKLNRSIVFEDKFKNIDITVRGPLEVIGQISTTEIKVEIDCSELEEGQHTVTPTITLPPKVSLVSAVPNEIKIKISE